MNITLALQAVLPGAKHTFKAILCATVLILAMPACRNGNEAQTTDETVADSLARLRQEGKAMRNESRFDEALQLHTRGLDLAKEVGDTAEWIQAWAYWMWHKSTTTPPTACVRRAPTLPM